MGPTPTSVILKARIKLGRWKRRQEFMDAWVCGGGAKFLDPFSLAIWCQEDKKISQEIQPVLKV